MNTKPCLNCPDRYPGCSSHCEKEDFLKDQARRKLVRDAKFHEYKREQLVLSARRRGIKRTEV